MEEKRLVITAESLTELMIKYRIFGTRARQKDKPSVRLLALKSGVNYNSLNAAMNGKRPFSAIIEAKLTLFFFKKETEQ